MKLTLRPKEEEMIHVSDLSGDEIIVAKNQLALVAESHTERWMWIDLKEGIYEHKFYTSVEEAVQDLIKECDLLEDDFDVYVDMEEAIQAVTY